jgi:hypothetical protein
VFTFAEPAAVAVMLLPKPAKLWAIPKLCSSELLFTNKKELAFISTASKAISYFAVAFCIQKI